MVLGPWCGYVGLLFPPYGCGLALLCAVVPCFLTVPPPPPPWPWPYVVPAYGVLGLCRLSPCCAPPSSGSGPVCLRLRVPRVVSLLCPFPPPGPRSCMVRAPGVLGWRPGARFPGCALGWLLRCTALAGFLPFLWRAPPSPLVVLCAVRPWVVVCCFVLTVAVLCGVAGALWRPGVCVLRWRSAPLPFLCRVLLLVVMCLGSCCVGCGAVCAWLVSVFLAAAQDLVLPFFLILLSGVVVRCPVFFDVVRRCIRVCRAVSWCAVLLLVVPFVCCSGAVPPTPARGCSWCCAMTCVLLRGVAVWCGLFCVVRGVVLSGAVLRCCAGALLFGVLPCPAVGFVTGRFVLPLAAPFLFVSAVPCCHVVFGA